MQRLHKDEDQIECLNQIFKSAVQLLIISSNLPESDHTGEKREIYSDRMREKTDRFQKKTPNNSASKRDEDQYFPFSQVKTSITQVNDSCYIGLDLMFSESNDDSQKESIIQQPHRLNNLDNLGRPQQNMRAARKGKSKQGLAQRFIKFMTGYFFTRNFLSYFNRTMGMTEEMFETLNNDQKNQKIQKVKTSLKSFKMKYKKSKQVEEFLDGFHQEKEKPFIIEFFERIARKTYAIMLESVLRMSLSGERASSHFKYMDQTGQKDFDILFDRIIQKKYFKGSLTNKECNFKERLLKQLDTKKRSSSKKFTKNRNN